MLDCFFIQEQEVLFKPEESVIRGSLYIIYVPILVMLKF